MKYFSAWDLNNRLYSATIDHFESRYHVYFSQPSEEIHHISFDNELDAVMFALNWIGTRH